MGATEPDRFEPAALEFFETQVRPILVNRCYECHSGQAEELKGGLRLDSRGAALAGGDTGPAIVPGKPDQSLLVDAVNYGDLYQMPPQSKLSPEEIAALTQWVALRAPWPDEQAASVERADQFDLAARKAAHWCWQPVRPAVVPAVARRDWPRQTLDYFILQRFEERGLAPAPPADKRTLIRRAYFDLIGLPPSPEEVETFVQDNSATAFERVVDQLLDSPHFGEHWARHWMDLVRYAETFGHEFDYPIPHAYKYRDYLIRAFNADVPYDQFLLEHVAGDLLEHPRQHPSDGSNEAVIATSFWWLGEATHAPVDVRGDQAGRVDNQLDVFGKTFLALTIGCARCHDHKFDAISTRDYYALAGILKSSRRDEPLLDPHGRITAATQQLTSRKSEADARFADARASVPLTGELFRRYLLAARRLMLAQAASPHDQQLASTLAAQCQLDVEQLQAWVAALSQEGLAQPSHPLHIWWQLTAPPAPPTCAELQQRVQEAAEQAEALQQQYPRFTAFDGLDDWFVTGPAFGSVPTGLPEWDADRGDLHAATPGIVSSRRLSTKLQGVLRSPTFTLTHPQILYRIKGRNAKVRLVLDGYFMNEFSGLLFQGFAFDVNTDDQFLWHAQAQDVGRYLGHRGYIEILDQGDGYVELDEIRFSKNGAPPERLTPLASALLDKEVDSLEDLAAAYGALWHQLCTGRDDAWSNAELVALWNWAAEHKLLHARSETLEELGRLQRALQELDVPPPERVLGLTEGTGENERIYVRGNHRTLGAEAPRQLLEALRDGDAPLAAGSGRRELARQLADPANPLTARVMANRLWHHVMGRGIVASTDNFGVLGEAPTHPELLDLLAHQLVQENWSIKRLLRSILLSSTYQMSSTPTPQGLQLDPQNLLLHHMRVKRLQGEAIRDAMLVLSGELDRTLFGPSVPVHITPFMQGRGRPKESGPLDGARRRTLYTEVRRNFLPPMMLAFDTPIPFNTVGRRNVSNVPAQALIMMNDPLVVEQARRWARRILRERDAADERVRRLYLAAFARPPSESEQADALAFLREQYAQYHRSEEAASADHTSPPWLHDERVWADLCHVLLNVKEFVFVN